MSEKACEVMIAPAPWKEDEGKWYMELKYERAQTERVGKGIEDYFRLSGIAFSGGSKPREDEEGTHPHWEFEVDGIKITVEGRPPNTRISFQAICEDNIGTAKVLANPISMIIKTSKEHSSLYFPKISIKQG